MSKEECFSIIIPNHNRADALPETLSSLACQSLDKGSFEVVVVDDGSTDHSISVLDRLSAQVPFPLRVTHQDHQRPGAARNRGVEMAQRDLLLFWDADMIADPQMLQTHVRVHERQGRLLVAGARRPWEAAYSSTFGRAMYADRLDRDQFYGKSPSIWEVFSANLSIRRDDFEKIGGFDEDLWAFEDIDFALRAQEAGLSLVFAYDAIGYHNHPMTLEQACRRERHYQKQAAFFLRKHPELEGQIEYLVDKGPVRLGYDPVGLIARKVVRRLIATRPLLAVTKTAVTLLEKCYPNPRILRFLYWKILSSFQLIGYREGLRVLAKELAHDGSINSVG